MASLFFLFRSPKFPGSKCRAWIKFFVNSVSVRNVSVFLIACVIWTMRHCHTGIKTMSFQWWWAFSFHVFDFGIMKRKKADFTVESTDKGVSVRDCCWCGLFTASNPICRPPRRRKSRKRNVYSARLAQYYANAARERGITNVFAPFYRGSDSHVLAYSLNGSELSAEWKLRKEKNARVTWLGKKNARPRKKALELTSVPYKKGRQYNCFV